MITNGSIDLLLKIFHNDKMVLNPIKWHAMQIIGYLFKAYPIPVEYGHEIINQLKEVSKSTV